MMEVFQEHKRDIIVIVVIFALLCISIGYAALSSNLTINGASQIKDAVWDIHWENIHIKDGSVTAISAPTIESNKTTVSYEVHFDTPGQFFEFSVDAVNAGTIDGMINTINSTLNGNPISTLPNYFDYAVTYFDGIPIEVKQPLDAGTTETYRVRIEYKKDIQASDLPSTDQDLVLSFTVTYVQKDSSSVAIPRPISFAVDSWDTIISVIRHGDYDFYQLGDTKEIDMGEYGTHTIRIANKSTPSECSQAGFSQTACGFVIEFADIIDQHTVRTNNDTTGGWPACEARRYVNNEIYNSLPADLKSYILDTYVVSDHNDRETEIYTSTDKLYLLAAMELWGYTDDTADLNRQLDLYDINDNVMYGGSTSTAIKTYNGSPEVWTLRTPNWASGGSGDADDCFFYIWKTGVYGANNQADGISPAFRIG